MLSLSLGIWQQRGGGSGGEPPVQPNQLSLAGNTQSGDLSYAGNTQTGTISKEQA